MYNRGAAQTRSTKEKNQMAIESLGNGGMAITGEHIDIYRLLAIRSALKIQVRTGLKSRAPVPQIARDILADNGIKPAKKLDKLFEQYEKFLKDAGIFQS
jgi:hypothetical protein